MPLSGILGQLSGGFGKLDVSKAPARHGFRGNYEAVDGLPVATYGTEALVGALCATSAGGFVKIWQTIVPAQQMIHWGFGSAALFQNQGYAWFVAVDATTEVGYGRLRLVQANARETKRIVVAEFDTRRLSAPQAAGYTVVLGMPTDREVHMVPLPEKVEYPLVGEDSLLILEYHGIVGTVANLDACGFSIPITIYQ